ncbi:transposase [Nonomuraea sp. NPDC049709]|uniref:transposase n=1 Tax=Nonomuraea sp. NPDC049709 TaxID=3154736 RepID=UPI00341BF2F5
MAKRRKQFAPEFKEEAVRMMLESDRTVASVAREFDINASTLSNWVNRHRITSAQDKQPPVSGPERARIREREQENAELHEKLIFLKRSPWPFRDATPGVKIGAGCSPTPTPHETALMSQKSLAPGEDSRLGGSAERALR